MPAAAGINIVEYEDGVNLRQVSWNQRFLERVKNDYKLKHGQAVLYRNVAQDRWRLVACFYGIAVLILPPIDPDSRLSLDITISSFLKKFSKSFNDGLEALDYQIKVNRKRLKRIKEREEAEANKPKRKKR